MDYRIAPARLGRQSSRAVLTRTVIVAVLIAAGIGGAVINGRSDHESGSLGTLETTEPTERTPPRLEFRPELHCHDVPAARCAEIADAAIRAIDDPALPPTRTVDVWASLICGSTFDCPPYHLVAGRPAGSAVVGLAGSMVLRVNVTEVVAGAGPEESVGDLDAWVISSGAPAQTLAR